LPDCWQENLRFRSTARSGDLQRPEVAKNIDDAGIHDRGALRVGKGTLDDDVRNAGPAPETGAGATGAIGVVPRTRTARRLGAPGLVVRLPHRGGAGDQCRRDVWHGLHRSVLSSGWGGPVGEPSPEDVEQRDRSRAVVATLAEGSPERAFYDALAETAEAAIRLENDHDRRFLEHRDW
jgi:hypothetical protein